MDLTTAKPLSKVSTLYPVNSLIKTCSWGFPFFSITVTMSLLNAFAQPYSIIVPIEIVWAPSKFANNTSQVWTSWKSLLTKPFSPHKAFTKSLSSSSNSKASFVLSRCGEIPVIPYFASSEIADFLQEFRSL